MAFVRFQFAAIDQPTFQARNFLTDRSDSIEQSIDSMTTSWLVSAKSGDNAAWNRLIRAYGDLIRWWCRKGQVASADIDDLMQEILAGVAHALPTYEHHSFRGFLWTVTCNKIKDYWRTQKRQPVAEGGSEIDDVLRNVEAESSRSVGAVDAATKIVFDSIVQLVRSEFSERDWQVFWDYAVEGKNAADVAAMHGVSRNQVFLAKSRILRRIRDEFRELESGR